MCSCVTELRFASFYGIAFQMFSRINFLVLVGLRSFSPRCSWICTPELISRWFHVFLWSGVFTSTHFTPPGEKAALACRRSVAVVGVALLAAERWPALTVPFIGCGDIDVALTEPLARTQTRAGISTQARAILRGRKACVSAAFILCSFNTRTIKLTFAEFDARGSPNNKS